MPGCLQILPGDWQPSQLDGSADSPQRYIQGAGEKLSIREQGGPQPHRPILEESSLLELRILRYLEPGEAIRGAAAEWMAWIEACL